ncbi:hypothetical protein Poli38472_010432 [Pythium oligandrum]|uniref:PNPLA domain-containing protein n=1 Tax=Pythium oligandrum TaxID=41045 RepID=A0A8K1C349_PYTOL|nr:hypothetical protein Poli38472_010432 [Pythium oligandrum]|eukprot:TMW55550.1 hypothetical protein Poli38472_010432 [Pythium oligandrum]
MTQTKYEYSFSFSGAGWMMVYEFGVAKALQQHNIQNKARFIGTSAGSLASVGLTFDNDFDAIVNTVVSSYVPRAYKSFRGPFRMRDYLIDALTKHANLHRYEELNQNPGKTTIVYSSLSAMKARRVTKGFRSKDHLLKTLIASCCATPLVGMPFKLDGELVMDGGLFDNQPLFEDDPEGKHTVTVNPNSTSDADIKPSEHLPPWWTMFPPSQADMYWAYDLGFKDGLTWLESQGLVKLEEELEPQDLVAVTPTSCSDLAWKTETGKLLGYREVDRFVFEAVMLWTVIASIIVVVTSSMTLETKKYITKVSLGVFADLQKHTLNTIEEETPLLCPEEEPTPEAIVEVTSEEDDTVEEIATLNPETRALLQKAMLERARSALLASTRARSATRVARAAPRILRAASLRW